MGPHALIEMDETASDLSQGVIALSNVAEQAGVNKFTGTYEIWFIQTSAEEHVHIVLAESEKLDLRTEKLLNGKWVKMAGGVLKKV